MRTYLLRILVFCTGLLLLNVLGYMFVKKKYLMSYEQVKLDFDTYLLSDSHGKRLGDITEEFNVYNFSSLGDSYYDMRRKLEYLIRETEVSKVIIGLPDYGLSNYRDSKNNLDRSIYFSNLKESDNKIEYLSERYLKRYIVLLNPKSRDILVWNSLSNLSSLVKGDAKDNDREWSSLSYSEQKKLSEIRAKEQFYNTELSEPLFIELGKIISICKEHEIELIGIKFPVTEVYMKAIGFNCTSSDSLFKMNNLEVFDYRQLYFDKNEFFRDQDHLNPEGSKVFVKMIAFNEVF